MTPEELNRTIEFITASQARLAAAQEQDRRDRVQFEEWSKGLSAQMAQLITHQSERMDRLERFYIDSVAGTREFQKEALRLLNRALHMLNLILDRLPPASANPN